MLLLVLSTLIIVLLSTFNWYMPFIMITLLGKNYTYSIWWEELTLIEEQWLQCKPWATGAFPWCGKFYLVNWAFPVKIFKKKK